MPDKRVFLSGLAAGAIGGLLVGRRLATAGCTQSPQSNSGSTETISKHTQTNRACDEDSGPFPFQPNNDLHQ